MVFKESVDQEALPPSMTQGLISLIPKPDKDLLSLDNWRPITLINNDSKIIASIFAERLKLGLEFFIDEGQSGFIKGRHICNNIRLVLDLIDYNEIINEDSFILFVDFYKAFDTIEHDFIFKTLKFFGFGDKFQKVIRTLYNKINSSVKLANGTSHRFEIKRGIRQGHCFFCWLHKLWPFILRRTIFMVSK